VDVIFDSIAAALRKGEKVTLPIGTLEVLDRKRRLRRGWFLKRVRVIYVQRKYIQFTPDEGCLDEPTAGENGTSVGRKVESVWARVWLT
jgi:hypothetical protein